MTNALQPVIACGRAMVSTIQRLQAVSALTDAEHAELKAAQAELRELVATASPTDTAQVLTVLDPDAKIPIYGHSAN
jgi:hypothetical protein